jgi:hypothetical protein
MLWEPDLRTMPPVEPQYVRIRHRTGARKVRICVMQNADTPVIFSN